MQYTSAPYVITEEEDSKDKKVGKAKNLSRYLTEKCKIWGRLSENLIREANNWIEHFSFALYS